MVLIETLRWEAGSGFVRLDRHLARLFASARTLGFPCNPTKIEAALDQAIAAPARQLDDASALRIRLALDASGDVTCSAEPFVPLPPDATWTLKFAETRLARGDPLLRHKTTRRGVYAAARAEYTPNEADEILLLNERDELCEGTITSVFVDIGDDLLRTPALECGLLAGVLRAELLETGAADETILTRVDLARAKAIFVGNSLRGLIKATVRNS